MQQDHPAEFGGGPDGNQKPSRLSDIVRSMDTSQDTTIGELADSLGERAFGTLMFILAVPNIIPGVAAILGLPLMFLAFQLMIGRQTLWLPDRIRERRIAPSILRAFVEKVLPILKPLEMFLKPRLGLVVNSNFAEKAIGLVAFPLTVVLFLPIPSANLLPTLAISCLALGLAERDGLMVSLGYVLVLISMAWLTALVFISSALYAAAVAFVTTLFGG